MVDKLKIDACKTCSKRDNCKLKVFYDDTSCELKRLIFPSYFTITITCWEYEKEGDQ